VPLLDAEFQLFKEGMNKNSDDSRGARPKLDRLLAGPLRQLGW